ncbi:uncharacterized protein G2W53_009640 [Senna tora]|uniref:Uncharacterized protein n=1 Tax=Senna tora TaxID=362788 RepID=A0A835CAD9_9FABA|nr:uncharacterized protein G2W53_009640 [Senna tora]
MFFETGQSRRTCSRVSLASPHFAHPSSYVMPLLFVAALIIMSLEVMISRSDAEIPVLRVTPSWDITRRGLMPSGPGDFRGPIANTVAFNSSMVKGSEQALNKLSATLGKLPQDCNHSLVVFSSVASEQPTPPETPGSIAHSLTPYPISQRRRHASKFATTTPSPELLMIEEKGIKIPSNSPGTITDRLHPLKAFPKILPLRQVRTPIHSRKKPALLYIKVFKSSGFDLNLVTLSTTAGSPPLPVADKIADVSFFASGLGFPVLRILSHFSPWDCSAWHHYAANSTLLLLHFLNLTLCHSHLCHVTFRALVRFNRFHFLHLKNTKARTHAKSTFLDPLVTSMNPFIRILKPSVRSSLPYVLTVNQNPGFEQPFPLLLHLSLIENFLQRTFRRLLVQPVGRMIHFSFQNITLGTPPFRMAIFASSEANKLKTFIFHRIGSTPQLHLRNQRLL